MSFKEKSPGKQVARPTGVPFFDRDFVFASIAYVQRDALGMATSKKTFEEINLSSGKNTWTFESYRFIYKGSLTTLIHIVISILFWRNPSWMNQALMLEVTSCSCLTLPNKNSVKIQPWGVGLCFSQGSGISSPHQFWDPTRVSMELSNHLVSWVITNLGDFQPTYVGVIIQLLSTMDIPAWFLGKGESQWRNDRCAKSLARHIALLLRARDRHHWWHQQWQHGNSCCPNLSLAHRRKNRRNNWEFRIKPSKVWGMCTSIYIHTRTPNDLYFECQPFKTRPKLQSKQPGHLGSGYVYQLVHKILFEQYVVFLDNPCKWWMIPKWHRDSRPSGPLRGYSPIDSHLLSAIYRGGLFRQLHL